MTNTPGAPYLRSVSGRLHDLFRFGFAGSHQCEGPWPPLSPLPFGNIYAADRFCAPVEVWPHVGASLSARLANIEIRQPHHPTNYAADRDGMAAVIIRAVDEEPRTPEDRISPNEILVGLSTPQRLRRLNREQRGKRNLVTDQWRGSRWRAHRVCARFCD